MLRGLAEPLSDRVGAIALGMALLEAVLFVVVPNSVHRVWSASAGACAVALALADWHLQAYAVGLLSAACAWVWLNEFRYAKRGTMLRAGGYELVLAMAGAASVAELAGGARLWFADGAPTAIAEYHLWIGAALGGAVLLWAVWRLLVREGVGPTSRGGLGILAAAGIVALATLKAPALAPAVLILLFGHGNGNRVLAGLGVAALLGYVGFYYYSLDVTLLHKSLLMAAAGSPFTGASRSTASLASCYSAQSRCCSPSTPASVCRHQSRRAVGSDCGRRGRVPERVAGLGQRASKRRTDRSPLRRRSLMG